MRVIKDRQSRCAIVISESPDNNALVLIDPSSGIVVLQLHPTVWGEIASTGEMIYDSGRIAREHIKWSFEEMWRPVIGSDGHPTTAHEAARKFLRGVHRIPEFGNGAVEALTRCLPTGDVHLFTQESGFIGRFAASEDAILIARAHQQKPIYFECAADIKKLTEQEVTVIQQSLDADRKWPQKVNPQEIFAMSKKKEGTAPKKIQKVDAAKRRADGPVAKARAIFEKMRGKDSKDIIAECTKAGINKGTTSVQLGKWRKENGIVVQRGGGKKTPKAKAEKTTKPADKPKAKKKAAVKKAKKTTAPVKEKETLSDGASNLADAILQSPVDKPTEQPAAPAGESANA